VLLLVPAAVEEVGVRIGGVSPQVLLFFHPSLPTCAQLWPPRRRMRWVGVQWCFESRVCASTIPNPCHPQSIPNPCTHPPTPCVMGVDVGGCTRCAGAVPRWRRSAARPAPAAATPPMHACKFMLHSTTADCLQAPKERPLLGRFRTNLKVRVRVRVCPCDCTHAGTISGTHGVRACTTTHASRCNTLR